jgi:hypothetical protein
MKQILFAVVCLISMPGTAQTKKELKVFTAIYGAALDHFEISNNQFAAKMYHYEKWPANRFILIDSTQNGEIKRYRAYDYTREFFLPNYYPIDTSWIGFFKFSDKEKTNLVSYKVPALKTIMELAYISEDSMQALYKKGNTGKANMKGFDFPGAPVHGVMKLGNIIRRGNKAIFEMSYTCGMLCGEGVIYLMQKVRRRWLVVARLSCWQS